MHSFHIYVWQHMSLCKCCRYLCVKTMMPASQIWLQVPSHRLIYCSPCKIACFNSSFANMGLKQVRHVLSLFTCPCFVGAIQRCQCTAMMPQDNAVSRLDPPASASGSSFQVHIVQHARIFIMHHVHITDHASCICHAYIMHHTSHITHHASHRWTTANKEDPQRQACQLLQTSIDLVIVQLPRQG
jgi:hypothetical protein